MRMPAPKIVALPLLLIVAAAVLVGCGTKEETAATVETTATTDRAAGEPTADDGAGAGKVAAVTAELAVQITDVGGDKGSDFRVPPTMQCTKSIPATCNTTVECPAAEGDETALAVCTWLAVEGREALAAVDEPQRACTMIYGGPAVATVTGTLDDEPVDATFSRQDGCAIARFDAASTLWTGEVPGSARPVVDPAPGAGAPAPGGAAAGSCVVLPPDTPVASDSPAGAADDSSCAAPAAPPQMEPEVISDPPEAFR